MAETKPQPPVNAVAVITDVVVKALMPKLQENLSQQIEGLRSELIARKRQRAEKENGDRGTEAGERIRPAPAEGKDARD